LLSIQELTLCTVPHLQHQGT